jgi:hypothetical protein
MARHSALDPRGSAGTMLKPVALATLVGGTLDILFAMLLTVLAGRHVGDMLRYVASGPLPAAKEWGTAGAALGLFVHFALMAIMAAIFMAIVARRPELLQRSLLLILGCGLVTYFVMNWLVVPIRFGSPVPPPPRALLTQLFAHLVLVAVPFFLIAKSAMPNVNRP